MSRTLVSSRAPDVFFHVSFSFILFVDHNFIPGDYRPTASTKKKLKMSIGKSLPPPPPNSVILIVNFLSFRTKTQWDVPSWDSSPSLEEEHPYVVPEPDHASVSAHSYVDMDEVRQTSSLIVATTSLSTQNEI